LGLYRSRLLLIPPKIFAGLPKVNRVGYAVGKSRSRPKSVLTTIIGSYFTKGRFMGLTRMIGCQEARSEAPEPAKQPRPTLKGQ